MKQPNWTRILTILLVLLAGFAVLYIVGSILVRFKHPIFIFTIGALLAYMLAPLVGRLELILRSRSLAIIVSYVMLATLLGGIGYMLFTPFIQQSQSLVANLQTPSSQSLTNFRSARSDTGRLESTLLRQKQQYGHGSPIPQRDVSATDSLLQRLNRELEAVRTGTLTRTGKGTRSDTKDKLGRLPPNPSAQTQIPALYISAIETQMQFVATDYATATASALLAPSSGSLAAALKHARKGNALTGQNYNTVSHTPILLLRGQSWLDEHNIPFDLHDRFGQAASTVSNQGSTVLNNAVTILQGFANALVNIALIVIVAFYFLSDGRRLVRSGMHVVPANYRDQVWYFVSSLDRVLGGYIRGQLFLSALAGLLAGAGAAALGVPYPLLIGLVTFVLQSIPVIGPMAAVFPGIIISVFFLPFVTTLLLLAWNVIYQQIVTNILGPRVMGMAVGIHPLEAILAVLVGYPLGGFLGAFLAVPVMGLLHILIREFYHYIVHGQDFPTADPTELLAGTEGNTSSAGPSRREPVAAGHTAQSGKVQSPIFTRLFAMLSMRRGNRANSEGKAPKAPTPEKHW